jgi:hypothetical protein
MFKSNEKNTTGSPSGNRANTLHRFRDAGYSMLRVSGQSFATVVREEAVIGSSQRSM